MRGLLAVIQFVNAGRAGQRCALWVARTRGRRGPRFSNGQSTATPRHRRSAFYCVCPSRNVCARHTSALAENSG